MRVLGIESSTVAASAALVEDGALLGEVWLATLANHSQRLLGAVARLMELSGTSAENLDGVAVGLGPGSFTGVRVALSTAKGLAFGLGIPLVGIPTLEALVAGVSHWYHLVCPMVDARGERIFTGLFRIGQGSIQKLREEGLRELVPWVLGLNEPVLFVGDGAIAYRQLIQNSLGDLAKFVPVEYSLPRASSVARLGEDRLRRGDKDDIDLLAPRYAQEAKAVRDMACSGQSPVAG